MSFGGKYKQGTFKPRNPSKYKGKFPITYRSSLELRFMVWCDMSPGILQWASESAVVSYLDPTRKDKYGKCSPHNYLIDFTIVVRDKNGNIKKHYVEVKPESETHPPVKGRKRDKTYITEQLTYARNIAKWESAANFARSKGATFTIITEKDIVR